MATGLRAQWRQAAMRTIQDQALALFDERGFDAVTIEQVAAAAEVSPSSVYRYFGTKEGLVVADEFDALTDAEVEELFDPQDLVGSMLAVVDRYESASDGADPWRRVRYHFQVPSVRMAALATFDRAAARIAPLLEKDGASPTRARAVASAITFGYFAALEQWYLAGAEGSIAPFVEDALAPLRDLSV